MPVPFGSIDDTPSGIVARARKLSFSASRAALGPRCGWSRTRLRPPWSLLDCGSCALSSPTTIACFRETGDLTRRASQLPDRLVG
jgi:hypothetical protein